MTMTRRSLAFGLPALHFKRRGHPVIDVVTEVMPGHGERFVSVGGPCYPEAFSNTKRVIVCLDGKQLSYVTLANEADSMVMVFDFDERGNVVLDPKDRNSAKRVELSGKVELFLETTETEHEPRLAREQNTRDAITRELAKRPEGVLL